MCASLCVSIAKAAINPPQAQHLVDLMNADISLESEGVVG